MKIEISIYISDYTTVQRSFMERFFTRPWNPLKTKKRIYSPTVFLIGDTCYVSPQTFTKIEHKELDLEKLLGQ
jgi:hypothetical protein